MHRIYHLLDRAGDGSTDVCVAALSGPPEFVSVLIRADGRTSVTFGACGSFLRKEIQLVSKCILAFEYRSQGHKIPSNLRPSLSYSMHMRKATL